MKWSASFTLQNESSTTGMATLTDPVSGFAYSGQLDTSYPAAVSAFIAQANAGRQAYVANLAAQTAALAILQAALVG